MPPALSDDENGASSGEEEIPFRAKGKQPATAQDEAKEDDAEEDDGEDEYVVEKILSHKPTKNEVLYEVKWLGYDDPKDRTWEPQSNLEGAIEILHEYWEEIGGCPEPLKSGTKRKGRKSAAGDSEAGTPAASTKRPRKEKEWSPPPGSWENDVDYVETVAENIDPKTGDRQRSAYLVWSNSKKSQHPLKLIYTKCPQKMLEYYESHLVFTANNDDDMNGAA